MKAILRPGRGRRAPTAGWLAPRAPRAAHRDPQPGQSSAAILRRRPRDSQDASWRTGTQGRISSMRWATRSVIRRPPQLGQKPRPLQECGTNRSKAQPSQRNRAKPWARTRRSGTRGTPARRTQAGHRPRSAPMLRGGNRRDGRGLRHRARYARRHGADRRLGEWRALEYRERGAAPMTKDGYTKSGMAVTRKTRGEDSRVRQAMTENALPHLRSRAQVKA